jgi:hypothetical protein
MTTGRKIPWPTDDVEIPDVLRAITAHTARARSRLNRRSPPGAPPKSAYPSHRTARTPTRLLVKERIVRRVPVVGSSCA